MITPETEERYPALAEVVEGLGSGGRWLVLTHDNPDPDCLAAGASLARVLGKGFKRRVTLGYGGLIGRAENQEMVRLLGIRVSHRRHLNWKNYRHFALVDTQPRTGNNQLPEEIVPDLVFDHHPMRQATQKVAFADIRTSYGATATILAEYLVASGVEIPRKLATSLVYAIRSETQDFAREFGGPDKRVYDDLLPRADRRALARIQAAPVPLGYFRTLHEALENLHGVDNLVVSHLDEVEQPDIVPEIADLLLRLEGKTWSFCSGPYGDRLYLSARTTNPRADAGRLMRKILGRRGKGGGHGMTAGGWIPVDRAPGGDLRALQEELAGRLARGLNRDPERLKPLPLA